MTLLKEGVAKEKAREISNWLQDAVGDAALGQAEFPDMGNDKYMEKIKKMKKAGKSKYIISEWLADELYNDADTLQDICGDRIHDAVIQLKTEGYIPNSSPRPLSSGVFNQVFCEVATALKENGHTALKIACDKLMERRV